MKTNSWLKKYYSPLLTIILAFTFFTRTYRLNIPQKYIFDEVYHVVTAKLILHNDQQAYEWNNPPPEPNTAVDWLHPPLAKYTQAISMKIFGINSFGWRFSSVLFGVLTVYLTARLAFNLFNKNYLVSLLSALIASLDGLLLTMSRIAMNDIHLTFFILLSLNFFIIYLNSCRRKTHYLLLSGLSSGLAVSSKWSGVFVIFIIAFFELLYLIKLTKQKIKLGALELTTKKLKKRKKAKLIKILKHLTLVIITTSVIPTIIYLLGYSHMFYLGKDLHHLLEMHKNIWWYQTNLAATHPASSKPIDWFLNLKPVWFDVNYDHLKRADIYAFGNPAIFWIGDLFIIITLGYLLYLAKIVYLNNKRKAQQNQEINQEKNLIFKLILLIKDKLIDNKTRENEQRLNEAKQLFFLIFSYFSVWIFWQFSPRIMFFYHYLPAVPLLSINTAFWLNKLLKNNTLKFLSYLIIISFIITFVIWYPHWTDIATSMTWKNKVYFRVQTWKQS